MCQNQNINRLQFPREIQYTLRGHMSSVRMDFFGYMRASIMWLSDNNRINDCGRDDNCRWRTPTTYLILCSMDTESCSYSKSLLRICMVFESALHFGACHVIFFYRRRAANPTKRWELARLREPLLKLFHASVPEHVFKGFERLIIVLSSFDTVSVWEFESST